MMKNLVIIGAGDFGREIANIVHRINKSRDEKEWNLLGFVDDNETIIGDFVDEIKVLGNSEWLNCYDEELYAICSLGTAKAREKVIKKFTNLNIKWATLIDPDARIYAGSSVGEGSVICGGSVVAIASKIGKHCVINLNCTLGHDDVIGDFSVINPGVNVSGKVHVHKCVDLGTGCRVLQGLSIVERTVVGAGGVVINNIEVSGIYVGIPVRKVK